MVWVVISAATDAGGESSQPIIVALISALGGVMVAVVTGLVAIARRESNDRRPPDTPTLGERAAVLERRAEDNDQRDDLQDHRLDTVERYLYRSDPDWRS